MESRKPQRPKFDDDLERSRTRIDATLKSTFEAIFDKFEKIFPEDEVDEINFDTGEVVVDNGHLRNMLQYDNLHSINVARHDLSEPEEVDFEETRRKWKYPPLPGDRDYVPEHHSTQGSRKRRRTKKLPTDQDLEQSAASSSIEDGDSGSQKDQPLCISKLKVAKTNQSGRPAGRAQRRTTTSKSSDQFTESDRDLEDKLASHRDVKVPCPRPECANHPTTLYRTSRFSKKEESELIQHQRKVHDYSEFPCTVEGCSKRGGNGYYRQGNLVNHMKEKHELYPPVIIHDKLASRYDVKAPCPRPQCANHPTALYRVGRLPKEAESELIEHQRKIHDYSEYPCTVEGCPRQRGNGYFRQGNLLKHLEKDHPPDKKILPNKRLYSDSEDELA